MTLEVYLLNREALERGYKKGAWFPAPLDKSHISEVLGISDECISYEYVVAEYDSDQKGLRINEENTIEEINKIYRDLNR